MCGTHFPECVEKWVISTHPSHTAADIHFSFKWPFLRSEFGKRPEDGVCFGSVSSKLDKNSISSVFLTRLFFFFKKKQNKNKGCLISSRGCLCLSLWRKWYCFLFWWFQIGSLWVSRVHPQTHTSVCIHIHTVLESAGLLMCSASLGNLASVAGNKHWALLLCCPLLHHICSTLP